MFERFTERARKVMALANNEAHRFNHASIGTEHILLGLIKEGTGVGANVLKNLDVDLRKVRIAVEKQINPGPNTGARGQLPQTPRAKKVLEYAIHEARNLNHNYVGTEHLLLGLLREEKGVAAIVLMSLDLKLERTREEVLSLLGAGLDVADTDSDRRDGAFEPPASSDNLTPERLTDLLESVDGMGHVTTLITEFAHLAAKGLTDVYIDFGRHVRLRHRIGGEITEADAPPPQRMPAIMVQLKHMAGMDPARRDVPQEGVIRNPLGTSLTLRVTTVPTEDGEVVIIHVES